MSKFLVCFWKAYLVTLLKFLLITLICLNIQYVQIYKLKMLLTLCIFSFQLISRTPGSKMMLRHPRPPVQQFNATRRIVTLEKRWQSDLVSKLIHKVAIAQFVVRWLCFQDDLVSLLAADKSWLKFLQNCFSVTSSKCRVVPST